MSSSSLEKDNVKNAITYIPFLAYLLYFLESDKSKRYDMNIKYSMTFCTIWIIGIIILIPILKGLLFLGYLIISAFMGYKAYLWEDIRIEFLDKYLK